MSVIYLAGPMRGKPQYNFPVFHLAKERLERQGHTVLSPATLDLEEGFDPDKPLPEGFMKKAVLRDIGAIVEAEAIALLPDWHLSVGARAELAVAQWLEMPVYLYKGEHPVSLHVFPNFQATYTLPEPAKPKEDILEEALRITTGDRQNSYGPPQQDFTRTATMWGALLGTEVTAKQVALLMIALKLSRATWSDKRDNFVDVAGYARCGWLCSSEPSV